ncbi:MAG: single-stranded DNA-binding protein [Bacilli bacterium]|nr:single-stranded DNA-binding protein [Bacilli bacterium]
MNKVILIGRLTRDPELRTTPSGVATTTFAIAVDRNFVNQQTGQREADFINCVAWRKQAENISRYCNKGSQVAVEGRIQTRNYDANDGTKRYVTEVICDNVTFLGSKNSNNNEENSSYNNSYSEPSPDIETANLNDDPYANMGDEVALTDDDLPFDFN